MDEERVYYTVEEAATMIGVSARWLADQCRAETVEHVHIARKRHFTRAQIDILQARFTNKPPDVEMMDATRARVVRQLERQREQRR